MNLRGWRVWCSVMLLAVSVVVHAADNLRIMPLVQDGEVFVSFELPDAYDASVHDSTFSGLQTTFTYNIELRMVVPFWVDRTVVSAVVSSSNHYDSLTGRHNLARILDGKIVETMVTQDEEVVKRWLTTQSQLPLGPISILQPNHDYYVRVRAWGRPQTDSLLGRVNNAITGQASFTFIP